MVCLQIRIRESNSELLIEVDRLSREDVTKNESAMIGHLEDLLKEVMVHHPLRTGDLVEIRANQGGAEHGNG